MVDKYVIGIPEGFLYILGVYIFSMIKIDKRKYVTASLITSVVIFYIRFLPIDYGVHTKRKMRLKMYNIRRISENIAGNLKKELNLEEEKYEVIEYSTVATSACFWLAYQPEEPKSLRDE